MTFERDLFISFSGGFFAGVVILIGTLVIELNISIYKKIILAFITIVLVSALYMIISFLLKKFYNKYVPWRM